MDQPTVSDARGRFRLRRLPLGRALQVVLEHPDFKATTQPSSVAPPGVLRGEQFRLLPKPAHAAAPAAARVLSELNGDRLPDLGSAPFTTRAQTGAPSHRDVLCVQEFLAGGDVRLVSCLFDYDNGIFVVRTYRFEPTDLPGSIQLRDYLVFRDGKWVAADMTAGDVERYRRKLRERCYWQLPDHPTADDIHRALEQ